MDFLAEAAEFPFILRHDVVGPVLRVEVVRDIAHREPCLLELAEREQEERMVVRLEMELSALLEQAAVTEAGITVTGMRMATVAAAIRRELKCIWTSTLP